VALLFAAGCGARAEKTTAADAKPRVVTVTIAEIRKQTVDRTVPMVGTLKGWEETTVGTKRAGRAVKIFHDMGDRIPPGEPLLELERVYAELAVAQAQRQLQAELAKLGLNELPAKDSGFDPSSVPAVVQAHVAVDRAKRNLGIQRGLTRQNAGIPQDLSNAENDLLAAEAALEKEIVTTRSTLANALALRVALDVAKQRRTDLVINAPALSRASGLDGDVLYAVTKRTVAEGQMMKEGDAVFDLVIENPLRLWANVPERFSPEIAVGQEVRLTVASRPGQTFTGKVARINPAVDASNRTIQVETLVPNPKGLLRPGGFAKGEILTRHEAEATVVPIESIVRFAGVTKTFVVEGESGQGKARAIEVETGLEGPGWIEVVGNLPARGRVVTTGQSQLAEGTPVAVRTPSEKTASHLAGP
jgi:RND family efflux transporter MFP subunit